MDTDIYTVYCMIYSHSNVLHCCELHFTLVHIKATACASHSIGIRGISLCVNFSEFHFLQHLHISCRIVVHFFVQPLCISLVLQWHWMTFLCVQTFEPCALFLRWLWGLNLTSTELWVRLNRNWDEIIRRRSPMCAMEVHVKLHLPLHCFMLVWYFKYTWRWCFSNDGKRFEFDV